MSITNIPTMGDISEQFSKEKSLAQKANLEIGNNALLKSYIIGQALPEIIETMRKHHAYDDQTIGYELQVLSEILANGNFDVFLALLQIQLPHKERGASIIRYALWLNNR